MGMMTIEEFGKIIDYFLWQNNVQMRLTLPAGTLDVEVQDNMDCGATVQFYILLKAIRSIAAFMRELMDVDDKPKEWAKTVDTLLGLVRNELMEE